MAHTEQIYRDGAWVASTATAIIPVVNPATEQTIAAVPAGCAQDVDRAVAAACAAFESWHTTDPVERAKYLTKLGHALSARAERLAEVITAEVGTPRARSLDVQVKGAVSKLAPYAELAERYAWEESAGAATVVRAPVGVVAAITPWNAPLSMAVDKVAPALLAGCPVVLKPSEVAPLSAWLLTEAVAEIGLPPGVFNLVSGDGATVGEALVRHPAVDMISFTGSTRAGTRIAALAAERAARVALEMGGKSANIVLPDADLDTVVLPSVQACFQLSGQVCTALTRLLVDQARYAEAIERISACATDMKVGDPNTDVDLGPVVSAAQRDHIRAHIRRGVAEGARLVVGGPGQPEGLTKGFYVRPTVFADVDNRMAIAQEEIFGPVLCVIPYEDEQDAVRIANDSRYGLSGNVWSADVEHARQVARRLRTGTVRINGRATGRTAPFGGFRWSGMGRTNGRYGLDEYVELQSISVGRP